MIYNYKIQDCIAHMQAGSQRSFTNAPKNTMIKLIKLFYNDNVKISSDLVPNIKSLRKDQSMYNRITNELTLL